MNAELVARLRGLADYYRCEAERYGEEAMQDIRQGKRETLVDCDAYDAGHNAGLCLDLRAAADALGRECETCRHSHVKPQAFRNNDHVRMCDRVSACGEPMLVCEVVGNGCNAWEAK